jgi:dienelactone hydrolase
MRRAALLLALALAAPGQPTAAQQTETLTLASRTLTDEAFLASDASGGAEVTLTARLSLPGDLPRYPVVILLHGTDGHLSGASYSWESFLPTIGVATLALDSYTGRGLSHVSFNQDAFGQFPQTYDTFRAVEALAAHPRIDPEGITVMGFSRGAQAALYTAMTRFEEAFGPEGASIAAHVAFYPACNVTLAGETEVGPAPIRIFTGADDDWTPAATCRAFADRLAAAGRDAVFTEYPGAHHGFDNEFGSGLSVVGGAMSSRDCRRAEVGGRIVNADTGAPFSYSDACVARGASVGYDPDAAARARAAVTDLLGDVFGLN